MLIYLAVFAISSLCFFYASKKQGFKRNILTIMGILLPAILAGVRADNIGTDVALYGKSMYKTAVASTSLKSYIEIQTMAGNTDVGFSLFNYALSRLFSDYHWGLFVYELLTVSFAYCGMRNCEKRFNTPTWIGMLLFYLSLYNHSLNLLRQMIAVAIGFYAISLLFENRYIRFALFCILAFTFHSSAIFCLLVLPMFLLLRNGRGVREKKQIIQGLIFIGAIIGIVAVSNVLITNLISQGILRENYLKYLAGGEFNKMGEGTSIPISSVAPSAVYLLLGLVLYRRMNKDGMENLFFLMNSLLVTMSCFGPMFAEYIIRIGYYFIPMQMVSVVNMKNCFKGKSIWYVLIISFALLVWHYNFVLQGYSETVPYMFFWNA